VQLNPEEKERKMGVGEGRIDEKSRRMSWEPKECIFFFFSRLSHNIWWVSASNPG